MNKNKILESIKNKEERFIVANVLDKYIKMEKINEITLTSFLNPKIMKMCEEILRKNNINFLKIYAFDEAQKGSILFYPEYIDIRKIQKDKYYDILRITPNNKKAQLEHKDYMGAVYNQGIKEELLGDIVVYLEYAYVICEKSINEYLKYNIKSVGRYAVEVENVSSNVALNKNEYNISSVIVTSMRLDSVVADVFNISRNKVVELIKSGKVILNYSICRQKDKSMGQADVFSVRGYGKCCIKDIVSRTKNDRYVLNVVLIKS